MNFSMHAHMTAIPALLLLASNLLAAQVPDTTNVQGAHHHYKLIDVGTFGGPNAFVLSPNPGEVLINHRGLVVGVADTPNADPYNPNCLIDCSLAHAFAWRDGVLRDLGALPGTNNSFAFSSNNRQQVVGLSETGALDPLTRYPTVHAALWSHGEVIDLGTLGGSVSWAGTINDRGQVAGASFNTVPDPFGGSLAVPSPFAVGTQLRAFMWEDGEIKDLGTLGGPDSQAQYINDRGQIVGQSLTNSIPNPPITAPVCPTAGIPTQHPFLWQGSLIRSRQSRRHLRLC
jgi:probable HAF family extracellular repeat protein